MFVKSLIIIFIILGTNLHAKDIGSVEIKNSKQNNNSMKSEIDIYDFVYNSKIKECILTKNKQNIDLFDPRFGDMKKPKRGKYRCSSWIKEPYSRCNILKNKSTSATALGFGRFKNTHLLIGFRNNHDKVDAQLIVECTK